MFWPEMTWAVGGGGGVKIVLPAELCIFSGHLWLSCSWDFLFVTHACTCFYLWGGLCLLLFTAASFPYKQIPWTSLFSSTDWKSAIHPDPVWIFTVMKVDSLRFGFIFWTKVCLNCYVWTDSAWCLFCLKSQWSDPPCMFCSQSDDFFKYKKGTHFVLRQEEQRGAQRSRRGAWFSGEGQWQEGGGGEAPGHGGGGVGGGYLRLHALHHHRRSAGHPCCPAAGHHARHAHAPQRSVCWKDMMRRMVRMMRI